MCIISILIAQPRADKSILSVHTQTNQPTNPQMTIIPKELNNVTFFPHSIQYIIEIEAQMNQIII
jgi:hypothetical protein